jgi:ATP-binding cassette, subfamily B, bacterial
MKHSHKLRLIRRVLLRFKRHVALTISLNVGAQVFLCAATVLFKDFLDRIPTLTTLRVILPVILYYLLLQVVKTILFYLDEYPYRVLHTGIYQWAKIIALEKMESIDYLAYANLGTGVIIQQIENGAQAVRNIAFFYLRLFTEIVPAMVINLIFVAVFDSFIFLLILGVFVLIFLLSFLLLKYLRRHQERILVYSEDFSRISVRGFMEMLVFRINSRMRHQVERLSGIGKNIVDATVKKRMLHEFFFAFFALITLAIEGGVILLQTRDIILGVSTLGTMVALRDFVHRIIGPIAIFNVLFVDFQIDRVTLRRFAEILDLPDDANTGLHAPLRITEGAIKLRGVNFRYGSVPVLSDFNLDIEGGRSTAIIGTTGAGKSTVLKLVLGLLKPTDGEVLVDSQPLAQIDLKTYYRNIAYMSQDAPVFDGTIRENLDLERARKDAELFEALEKTGLKEMVGRLPLLLETEIGEKGIKLSGGEKQRLALARMFLRRPRILILDEPTSAMDSITEEFITNSLFDLFDDVTIVIIAHRLQTIRRTERIIVMRDGRICQDGVFSRLIEETGVFKDMWETQISSKE